MPWVQIHGLFVHSSNTGLEKAINRIPLPTCTPFLVSTNLSDSKTILKPFLLRIEPDIRFLRISGTCSISFRASYFPDVHFSMTFPFTSTLETAELPMNSCSPCSNFLYLANNIFLEQMCRVAPVSTQQILLLVVRFTSDTTVDRLGNA